MKRLAFLLTLTFSCACSVPNYGIRENLRIEAMSGHPLEVTRVDIDGDGRDDVVGRLINPPEVYGTIVIWWNCTGPECRGREADLTLSYDTPVRTLRIANIDGGRGAELLFSTGYEVVVLRGQELRKQSGSILRDADLRKIEHLLVRGDEEGKTLPGMRISAFYLEGSRRRPRIVVRFELPVPMEPQRIWLKWEMVYTWPNLSRNPEMRYELGTPQQEELWW